MSRRAVRSVYARTASPSYEPEQGKAFYCGHCASAQTGTHYRCQLSTSGFCDFCDRDPGSAADGLITGRTCRKCYDRNRRQAQANTQTPPRSKKRSRSERRSASRPPAPEKEEDWDADEEKNSSKKRKISSDRGMSPATAAKKPKGKQSAPKARHKLTEEEREDLDYGFNCPWGEHNLPGGSAPPVFARRSAQVKPIGYLELFREILMNNPDYMRLRDNALPSDVRSELWDLMDEDVVDRYAWAIPDERALRVIQAIDIENSRRGVVEVGAGNGYWASLMLERGVDVVAYDLYPNRKYVDVRQGTPDVVKDHSDRILFLCYPDEFEESDESMALQCLEKFAGNYVIHVGELFGRTAAAMSAWGRSTAPEFQERLVKTFHNVLSIPLPSWPFALDTLTVWKRTTTLITEDGIFCDIPPNELMDVCKAAPRYEDLLY